MRIGNVAVASYAVLDSTRVRAVVPDGVGRGLSVSARSSTGRLSLADDVFSYGLPEVELREPAYLFRGETGARVLLYVSNAGFQAGDLESVELVDVSGDVETVAPCNESVSVDYQTGIVECVLPSTGSIVGSDATHFRVTVGG